MSRQLDLQLYLALHGYPLKEIPEERYDDYMREPHYSTDADAMLELEKEMDKRGWDIYLIKICERYAAKYWNRNYEKWMGDSAATTIPEVTALAAYKALTGKEWQD